MENQLDSIKIQVVEELGLIEKVMKYGWKSLSAKETGRIGGLVSKKKRLAQMGREG